jgi:uncharacterized membrane protein YiaA
MFSSTVIQQVFNNRIQLFYIDVVGLNAALAGIIWFIFGLWNAVICGLVLPARGLFVINRPIVPGLARAAGPG